MVLINKLSMEELHKSLITALAPITTATQVPVYDHIPGEQATYPYIVLRDMSESPWGDKTKYGSTVNVIIDTFISAKNSLSTKDLCNKIVKELVTNFTVTNFNLIYSELVSVDVSEMANSVYLGEVTINFFLQEV